MCACGLYINVSFYIFTCIYLPALVPKLQRDRGQHPLPPMRHALLEGRGGVGHLLFVGGLDWIGLDWMIGWIDGSVRVLLDKQAIAMHVLHI